MMGKTNKPLTAFSVILSIATLSSVSFAKNNDGCTAVVNAAALRAMDKTNPLGQTTVFGRPVAFGRDVLRVEVEVFGAQDEIFYVDVTIDGACHVLSTSVNLESNPWRAR